MADISTSGFLAGLKKSGIVEPDRLSELLEDLPEYTPEAIAKQLVRESLATQWQAKYLISGRSRLDIGSYRLLERINRDEFGDRFLAVHTSLARKVDIQVLPGSLTKDQSSCDRFIQKASLAAQLDHPNLTHVYDIDQEGGRYYLVTEHVEGKSLEETDVSMLSDLLVAQIISQAIDGIRYAHDHDVIHGCIGPADLILAGKQQVKIQHLPLSPLRQQLSGGDGQPKTEDDFSAIARIGSFLLKKAKITDPARRSELTGAFEQLSAASPEAVDATSKALAEYIAAVSAESESEHGGFDQPIATTSARREKKRNAEQEAEVPEAIAQPGYLGRLWRDNPAAVIGASLVVAVMLVGGSVYGGISLLGKLSPAVTDQVQGQNRESSDKQNTAFQVAEGSKAENSNKRLSNTSAKNQPAPRIPTEEEMNQFLAGIEKGNQKVGIGRKKNKNVKLNQPLRDPNSAPTAIENKAAAKPTTDGQRNKISGNRPPATKPSSTSRNDLKKETNGADPTGVVMTNDVGEPKSTQPPSNKNGVAPVKKTETSKPTHTDLTVIRGIAEKTQSTLRKGEVNSLEQMATMSPQEIQAALRKGGWGTANKIQEYKSWIAQAKNKIGDESPMKTSPVATDGSKSDASSPDTTGPFANFPRITELPPMEDPAEIKIANLVIKQQYLLGAELICEPGASKGRSTFQLERSEDDNQKWIVGVKKSPNQDSIPVAAFRKSENALHFQWLPETATDKSVNKLAPYLRNCFVKLILPDDETTILTLRKPIKIADLRLTTESLWNEVEFQIPAMPDPENVVVEVLPLQIPNVESRIPNSRVQRGVPARIWLKKNDKTGFLWIQVAGEFRSKLKLRSNLTLLVQGQTKPVPGLQALQELAMTLDAAAVQAQIRHDTFTKPASMKRGEFDQKKAELLKDARAKRQLKQRLINYGEILPNFMNQPIKVRVYSKLGNYQTVLAVSDPSIEQEKK